MIWSKRPACDARPAAAEPSFDYSSIPEGYYDHILHDGHPIRRLWHVSKFERVLDYLPAGPGLSIIDVGCFAGTFLSMAPPERFTRQLGVDILPSQIEYANRHYGASYRRFLHVPNIAELSRVSERFDCATLIEVIEHLGEAEIRNLLERLAVLLQPGGRLVITTPNYASTWPLLEWVLNRVSEVSYAEQHLTRFTFFNMSRRLGAICPALDATFDIELKTTTHFVTPFVAGLSFEGARRLSRLVPHRHWRLPFGNLVLMVLRRR
jgi:2-polyprenyl-3-methyl-5-hydroxy-6-metoxy-1,4-benzoquinol methylase